MAADLLHWKELRWRVGKGLSLLIPLPWNQQSFAVDFTGSRIKFKLLQRITQATSWQSPTHRSSRGLVVMCTYQHNHFLAVGKDSLTCICVFLNILLSGDRQSPLWAPAAIVQATAIVIPQASWQLVWLMVASIKMNFLQKAVSPSPFLPCMRLPALLRGLRHGEPSVILSVLGRAIPQAAGACLCLQPALAPRRERMVLVLWRKRSRSPALSYPRPAAGGAGRYLARSNTSRGREKSL